MFGVRGRSALGLLGPCLIELLILLSKLTAGVVRFMFDHFDQYFGAISEATLREFPKTLLYQYLEVTAVFLRVWEVHVRVELDVIFVRCFVKFEVEPREHSRYDLVKLRPCETARHGLAC